MKYLGTISDSQDLTTKKYVDDKVSGVSTSLTLHINNKSNPHSVTKSQLGLGNVENKSSATIRGEITSSNVTTALGYTPLQSSDLDGYATESWVEGKGYLTSAPVTSVNSKTGAVSLAASDVGAVPTTRKVNGKALSADITLSASDVGALPSTTTIPSKTSQLTNDSGFITSSDIPDLSTVIYGEDVENVEATTPLNADTLEGHTASYFVAASSLATVATSGSYNDLSNTPTSNQLRSIYIGTADPSSSLGSNGDIYIKYTS